MDNTLLINLSSQMAASRAMDAIANNLANVSTPAYKGESTKFEEYIDRVRPAADQHGMQPVSFVLDKGMVRNLNPGRIEPTGAPYDLAINGKGYFTVQTPAGNRYTRDGHFALNADGTLVDSSGNPLMGDGGPITITPDDGNIHIGADGVVTGKQGELGQVKLVSFANERALKKEGANLYSTTQTPQPAADATIEQGMLESSNVEAVSEIAKMIEVMRAYDATATLTQSQQQLQRQAIEQLGNVQTN